MNENPLIWVLLAPEPAAQLEARAEAFRREKLGGGEKYLPKWEVQSCSADYSAILSRNPGSERSLEMPLAETLSRELGKPAYVLYMDADYVGLEVVEVYEGGQHKENLPDDPYDFARRLGCPLPGDPKGRESANTVQSVVVVEDATSSELTSALGLGAAPPDGSVHVEDGPAGALLRIPAIGDLTMMTYRLSAAFPGRNVYKLSTGPMPGRFLCWIVRDGENVGVFEYPAVEGGSPSPSLDSIKGKTTPAGIADALGIPRDLLGMEKLA